MDSTVDLAPLGERDIELLYGPGMDDILDAFDDGLLVLRDLFLRHTGSWFGIQFPEEDHALRVVDDRLALLPPGPHRERIEQDLRAYLQLRDTSEREGPSPRTEAAARAAADTLHDQWVALIEYPLAVGPATGRSPAVG